MEHNCLDGFINDKVNGCRWVVVKGVAAKCVAAICTAVTALQKVLLLF
jgi:hypothetical protein